MAETAADRAEAVLKVQAATAGASPEVQAAAIHALIGNPGQAATDYAWRVLVTVLGVGLIVALGGLIYAVADGKTTTPVIAAFSSILSGLVGLYVKSPAQ